jgi:hypothetical protein
LLVFTEAPPSGTNNIEVIPLGMMGQVNTVADSTITANKIAANAVTTTKILDGNITFAKLDATSQRYIAQGDSNVQVSDSGTDGAVSFAIDGTTAFSRDATGVYSYIRGSTGGNFNTLYQEFQCRAWVNFNGTGTVAIRGAGNVASITDNGTGSQTINFTTAMPDTNFTANISVKNTNDSVRNNILSQTYNKLTTSFIILTHSSTPSAADCEVVDIIIFR